MKYTRAQIQEWNDEGRAAAVAYLKCEHRMVEILALMSESRGYYQFGCGSLFEYAHTKWNLPEYTARDLSSKISRGARDGRGT